MQTFAKGVIEAPNPLNVSISSNQQSRVWGIIAKACNGKRWLGRYQDDVDVKFGAEGPQTVLTWHAKYLVWIEIS